MNELYKIAMNAANLGYEIASKYLIDARVISNQGKDIKTEADLSINSAIIDFLQTTGIPILSEENISGNYNLASPCWIIDPLDGTYNFTRKFPFSSISISLWKNNEPVIGIVKNLFDGKTYSANYSGGAYLDGKQIKVSSVNKISNAILATGFPSGLNYSTENLSQIVSFIQNFKKVRAIGSASLMLCNVASGIFDVYYEKDIYLWDITAGLAILKEAGGMYSLKIKPNSFKCEVLATNKFIFNETIKELIH
jgi:fructose-1,6-bisphosphatase/inositol monophosphatase family enzyme